MKFHAAIKIFALLSPRFYPAWGLIAQHGGLQTSAPRRVSEFVFERRDPSSSPWTSEELGDADYNEETHVEHLPVSIEALFALAFCSMVASVPLLLAGLAEEKLTRTHVVESVILIVWFGGVLFSFTHMVKFQSVHWEGHRPLTIVEAVYLLSQILTTTGLGDIVPADSLGMVAVGLIVIIALCLYSSIAVEVFEMAYRRVDNLIAKVANERKKRPLKDWNLQVDSSGFFWSSICFALIFCAGVLFYHYFPGEGKTWVEATYFAVVTLSKLGFGEISATSEGGKVFGAFWMLIGVSSVGALLGHFVDLQLKAKEVERQRAMDSSGDFERLLRACADCDGKLDRYRFLKFGLLLGKGVEPHQIARIEMRFQKLAVLGNDGEEHPAVRSIQLMEVESPIL